MSSSSNTRERLRSKCIGGACVDEQYNQCGTGSSVTFHCWLFIVFRVRWDGIQEKYETTEIDGRRWKVAICDADC